MLVIVPQPSRHCQVLRISAVNEAKAVVEMIKLREGMYSLPASSNHKVHVDLNPLSVNSLEGLAMNIDNATGHPSVACLMVAEELV